MKRIILLAMCLAAAMLTSCLDVIRGNKTIVYLKADMESTVKFQSDPEVTVAADKNYSDAFKADMDKKAEE